MRSNLQKTKKNSLNKRDKPISHEIVPSPPPPRILSPKTHKYESSPERGVVSHKTPMLCSIPVVAWEASRFIPKAGYRVTRHPQVDMGPKIRCTRAPPATHLLLSIIVTFWKEVTGSSVDIAVRSSLILYKGASLVLSLVDFNSHFCTRPKRRDQATTQRVARSGQRPWGRI